MRALNNLTISKIVIAIITDKVNIQITNSGANTDDKEDTEGDTEGETEGETEEKDKA